MIVQTGDWKDIDSVLALYRLYVNGSDTEIANLGIHRDDILLLIRCLEGEESKYRSTALSTIANQMVKAFVAGRSKSAAKP